MNKNVTNREMAEWLYNNYKPYPLQWYMEDATRLASMYHREYGKTMKDIERELIEAQQQILEDAKNLMKLKYKEYYQRDYDEDFRQDRAATFQRAFDIRDLW